MNLLVTDKMPVMIDKGKYHYVFCPMCLAQEIINNAKSIDVDFLNVTLLENLNKELKVDLVNENRSSEEFRAVDGKIIKYDGSFYYFIEKEGE